MRTPACFVLALGLLFGTLALGNPFLAGRGAARARETGPAADRPATLPAATGSAAMGSAAMAPEDAGSGHAGAAVVHREDAPRAQRTAMERTAMGRPAATLASFTVGSAAPGGAAAALAVPHPALAARVQALPAAMLDCIERCEPQGDSLWLCLRDGRRVELGEAERLATLEKAAPRD